MDVITCGECNMEFPLSDITYFIHHKAVECRRRMYMEEYGRNRALICSSCSCKFRTAWSLLRHFQDRHNLKLYFEEILPEERLEKIDRPYNGAARDQPYGSPCRSPGPQRLHRHDSSCSRIESPDSYQCRTNIGEWEEHWNKSPVISPRSKYQTMMDQSDSFHNNPQHRVEGPFHESPNTVRGEPDPRPLDLKIVSRDNGSLCSDMNSDSENSSTGCANRPHQTDTESHSNDFQTSILPKKRKWSHSEQSDKTISTECALSTRIESNVSTVLKVSEQTQKKELITTPKSSCNVTFIPRWKYSMGLQVSPPSLIPAEDRHNTISPTEESGFFSSSSPHGSDYEDPRDIPASPGVVAADHEKSPDIILDGDFDNRSPIRSCSSKENCHPTVLAEENYHPAVTAQTIASHDLTLASVDSSGNNVNFKKRRYPTTRPFKCDHCDHSFNQRIHLKKHLSKHTGIKPFKCGLCDYSTVERSHLKVHVRIHTGEKPYKCTFCDYATAQNSTLKIHLKRHHGGQMFKCKTCGKCFTQLTTLNAHMKNQMHDSACARDQSPAQHNPGLLSAISSCVPSLA